MVLGRSRNPVPLARVPAMAVQTIIIPIDLVIVRRSISPRDVPVPPHSGRQIPGDAKWIRLPDWEQGRDYER